MSSRPFHVNVWRRLVARECIAIGVAESREDSPAGIGQFRIDVTLSISVHGRGGLPVDQSGFVSSVDSGGIPCWGGGASSETKPSRPERRQADLLPLPLFVQGCAIVVEAYFLVQDDHTEALGTYVVKAPFRALRDKEIVLAHPVPVQEVPAVDKLIVDDIASDPGGLAYAEDAHIEVLVAEGPDVDGLAVQRIARFGEENHPWVRPVQACPSTARSGMCAASDSAETFQVFCRNFRVNIM